MPRSCEPNAIRTALNVFDLRLVEVINFELPRVLREKRIDVGSIPLRVCDLIMRTCGHQKLRLKRCCRVAGFA